jgi:heme/copper-type cytochrome/quinol oxidase subunit 2
MGPNAPAIPPIIYYLFVGGFLFLCVIMPIVFFVIGLTAPTTSEIPRPRKTKHQFAITTLLIVMTLAALATVIVIKVRRTAPTAPIPKELNLDVKRS